MLGHHTHRFCVAPMMDGTDRHCRYFHRLLSQKARLYTEMLTADAVINGDRDRLLGFDPSEHPVALQLGGADPQKLADAAEIGKEFGYDEINLNVGCPSDRVQSGAFGACLMKEPELVAECMSAMRARTGHPITVKSRIAVDDQDPELVLPDFIEKVAAAGTTQFIIHARKAFLKGLSPKENREVPPLNYEIVFDIKKNNPDLTIILNGGLTTIDMCEKALKHVDGVMLGRAAYGTPRILMDVDERLYGIDQNTHWKDRLEIIIGKMDRYVHELSSVNVNPHHIVRHMHGLFQGLPGAKAWRRQLSIDGTATPKDVLRRAYDAMNSINCDGKEQSPDHHIGSI
ncbi:MAG: tRNA dihydrouridine(20/20a) synthase DusA [Pseudomonadota bacterium]